MKQPIIIKRFRTSRFTGISEAARRLKVSKQAVSNYVTGRYLSALSKEKASQIQIVEG